VDSEDQSLKILLRIEMRRQSKNILSMIHEGEHSKIFVQLGNCIR
jgi:hypothetical protein